MLPEIVREDEEGTKAVAYIELIPVLIEAIREQQEMIAGQQEMIARQQTDIEDLKKMIASKK